MDAGTLIHRPDPSGPATRAQRGLRCLVAAACVLAAHPAAATAQRWSLTFENDLIGVRGAGAPPDHDFTSGLRLAHTPGSGVTIGAAQEIYTPREDAADPVPGERPYAAWLYGFVAWRWPAGGGRSSRDLEAAVGVIGPSALGEPVQNGIHRLMGSTPQVGWDHQLRIGPTFQLRYRDGVRVPLGNGGTAALEPRMELDIGNVRVGATVALPIRVGMDTDLAVPIRGFGAGAELAAAWRTRDGLLDDPPLPHSPVARDPVLGRLRLALGYRFRCWALAYRFTMLTREYETQRSPHRYGSLTIAWFPGDRTGR